MATTFSFVAHEVLRDSQREMIEDGMEVLNLNGYLFAAAPTGIGKTAAALSAALTRAATHPEGRKTVLFLTGRQSQHRIVVDTVRRINSQSDSKEHVRLVDLIGQRGMCIHEIRGEHPAIFSRMCAEMRRTRKCAHFIQDTEETVSQILRDPLHAEEAVAFCGSSLGIGPCPWKVAREAAGSADIVVCDYNHVFIDSVREASLGAMGIDLEHTILVIDEAHNLPDRIRRGLERRLTRKVLRDCVIEMQEHRGNEDEAVAEAMESEGVEVWTKDAEDASTAEKALIRIRDRVGTYLVDLKRLLGEDIEQMTKPEELLSNFESALEETLDKPMTLDQFIQTLISVRIEIDESLDTEPEIACHRLAELLTILHHHRGDSALATVFDILGEEGRITTHLLDPGVVARPLLKQSSGGILMSGTLFPPAMYGDILGMPEQRAVTHKEYSSPFESDRRPVVLATDVTTRYKDRSAANTRKIRDHIHSLLRQTPGHVAVFLPSYNLLEEIIEDGSWPGRHLIVEERNWSKNKVQDVLDRLRRSRDSGQRCLLAGVYNARLSEGIDYEGNILDAVVCVGIPMAPPTASNQALRDYISDRFGERNAWKYSAAQPAMNAILQAMGRAIRKAEDRAIVLVLERRVGDRGYKACLPMGLNMFHTDNSETTERLVRRFFQRHPEPARTTE